MIQNTSSTFGKCIDITRLSFGSLLLFLSIFSITYAITEHRTLFPTSFPNACFSVTVNRQAGNDADDRKTYAVTATIITTTGFTIDRDDDIHGEDSINWIAVGN